MSSSLPADILMANWFCPVLNVVCVVNVCRKRLSSPRCRSELIDSASVVIIPGQKMHRTFFYIKEVLCSLGMIFSAVHALAKLYCSMASNG